MTCDCFSAPQDIVTRLRSTESRSKRELLDEAAEEIERLREQLGKFEQFKWIPVTERLPESGEHCLLSCEIHSFLGGIHGRYVCDGYYAERWAIVESGSGDFNTEYSEEKDEYFLLEGWYEIIKNWDDFGSVFIGDFVTHWMPLPEPLEVGE